MKLGLFSGRVERGYKVYGQRRVPEQVAEVRDCFHFGKRGRIVQNLTEVFIWQWQKLMELSDGHFEFSIGL